MQSPSPRSPDADWTAVRGRYGLVLCAGIFAAGCGAGDHEDGHGETLGVSHLTLDAGDSGGLHPSFETCPDGIDTNTCGGCGPLTNPLGGVCGQCGLDTTVCVDGDTACDGDTDRAGNVACLRPSGDTYVAGASRNENFGTEPILRVQSLGLIWLDDGGFELSLHSNGRTRALIEFDQSEIEALVGDSNLVSATIELFITDNGDNRNRSERTLDIHAMTVPWTELGATWNCAHDSDTTNSKRDCSGADRWLMGGVLHFLPGPWVPAPTDSLPITSGQEGLLVFDVTEDVRSFLDGTLANAGWLIRATKEVHNGRVDFASRETADGPVLVLVVEGCVGGGPPNACGGCGPLTDEPGDACGPCMADSVICLDEETTACSGSTVMNACGGCDSLPAEPGDSCGACGPGVVACDGTEATTCVGDTEPNACGGCGDLINEPDDVCGPCGLDVYECETSESTACSGSTFVNGCDGCSTLSNPPGTACGVCGLNQYVCTGPESTACDGDLVDNVCGGCEELANPPGTPCGTCGLNAYVCDGAESTVCNGDTTLNACGGCAELVVGDACGPCGLDAVVCDASEAVCDGNSGANACGTCTITDPCVGDLPPDPGVTATELDRSVSTLLGTSAEFLFAGVDPVQLGVDAGTIHPARIAVIRGRVLTRDGEPIPGVRVGVSNHPEYGYTLTREDGAYDLAVNGGGYATLGYRADGYLKVHRQVEVPWHDYVTMDDVRLVVPSADVLMVEANATASQVVRAGIEADGDGSRQLTLFVNAGTQATMALPDGSSAPLGQMRVRLTEFTVGPDGPEALPAQLPLTSGYTYAFSATVDEAEAVGAERVDFSELVWLYAENFLSIPAGEVIPEAYYDPAQEAWVPRFNGRVVGFVGVTDGLADLDFFGTGAPSEQSVLDANGVTDDEREMVAELYVPGQTLWRMAVDHFSVWDGGWAVWPPTLGVRHQEAVSDAVELTILADVGCVVASSAFQACQETLRGSIALEGTPHSLNYSSERALGRAAGARIVLTGSQPPADLQAIQLEIEVAGQRFDQSFPPLADQEYAMTWDRRDAYGRLLQGGAPITIRVGYTYDAVYQRVDYFGYQGSGFPLTGNPTREPITLWSRYRQTLEAWDAKPVGLGGWSLDMHHVYDPIGRVLYRGDGTRRRARALEPVIETVVGTGEPASGPDGGQAAETAISRPWGIEVGPDGAITFAETLGQRIRRVDPDGTITTIAGTGVPGSTGDGGPATEAQVISPRGVALAPDGSVYFAEYATAPASNRVRRIGPDGIITTVAGAATPGFSGDHGPAASALLTEPRGLDVGPDGSLFADDRQNERIRVVDPLGRIVTVAGGGGDNVTNGIPAQLAWIGLPRDVEVGPQRDLYVAVSDFHLVRRVGPDGRINTVAGNVCFTCGLTDGVPATSAAVSAVQTLAVAPDNSFYLAAERDPPVIQYVDQDGIINVIAGGGTPADGVGDGGPAIDADLESPVFGMTVGPDGCLYLSAANRIRRIGPPFPGVSGEALVVRSEDGSLVYEFSPAGRHLRTVEAGTGVTVYEFGYDGGGRLLSVADGAGNVTALERDGGGNLTGILGPSGERTAVALDENGYLAEIADPDGSTHFFSNSAGGLLETTTDPAGNFAEFQYDSEGRLIGE